MPKVSVILPVYNAEHYLHQSIGSILNQTFSDFELLVINDGSTDRSGELIESIPDSRLRFIDNKINQGTATVSNMGLELATGKYLAFMDADDVSLPSRLETQISFLEAHEEVGVLGTGSIYSDSKKVLRYHEKDEALRRDMFFFYPFRNPTLMVRNQVVQDNSLTFNPEFKYTLDFEFISRVIGYTQMANISEPLLIYTVHERQISTVKRQVFLDDSDKVCINMLRYLGLQPDETERKLHLQLVSGNYTGEVGDDVDEWIQKISIAKPDNPFFASLGIPQLIDRLHPSRRRFIFSHRYTMKEWIQEMQCKNYKYYSLQEILKNTIRPIIGKNR